MVISITKAEKGDNRGSCRKLAVYLEKENKNKRENEKEYFFDHEMKAVNVESVVRHIDKNIGKLSKKDAKFFLVNISPSADELAHINNDKGSLKGYTLKVMEEYARGFKKGLHSKDLVWYAKVEENRYYHNDDPAVKEGLKKQGEPKEGLNTHIQVIVSRKDRANKIKLSPLTTHKNTKKGAVMGGFIRHEFALKGIRLFDKLFGYKRAENPLAKKNAQINGIQPGVRKDKNRVLLRERNEAMQKQVLGIIQRAAYLKPKQKGFDKNKNNENSIGL